MSQQDKQKNKASEAESLDEALKDIKQLLTDKFLKEQITALFLRLTASETDLGEIVDYIKAYAKEYVKQKAINPSLAKKFTQDRLATRSIVFPAVDGHFWIERDGEIVDHNFKEHDIIKQINGLEGNMVYLEAPPSIQASMIRLLEGIRKKNTHFDNEVINSWEPKFGHCYMNSLLVQVDAELNGKTPGILKFGSMGWYSKNKSKGLWFEYGGPKYTLTDFLKTR